MLLKNKLLVGFGSIIRSKYTFTKISELLEKPVGSSVSIKGWIRSRRNMKETLFVDINDGTSSKNIQVLLSKENKPNLGYGTSIEASGVTSLSPRGQIELKADKVKVIGECPITDGFPFVAKQSHPPEYLREYLHLRPKINSVAAMLRVRHHASLAIQTYLANNGFIQINTPILTGNDCEGGGEVFNVRPENDKLLKHMARAKVPLDQAYFDKKAFLTVSGQLHLEAMCHGLGNVYTFGPTFRAENSKTPIHLSEFYMLEVEQSFVESLVDVTIFIEALIKNVTTDLLNKCNDDILTATSAKQKNAFSWLNKPFPTITYKEAISILEKEKTNIKNPIRPEDGLTKEQELFLVQYIDSPVFVVDWPQNMKPFYMRKSKTNAANVEALDLLVPFVGELAGGSIREDNYVELKNKLPPHLDWYLELRKFGGITTGGFGIGFERYLQFLLGIANIKDVIPFPRWPHNCAM